ncbi:MAG: 7-cyano-7-deazaguanine synthase [Halobacteria archaeon]
MDNEKTDRAVVLLSGGIDSATCLAMACVEFEEVIAVHINYGQQTADLEGSMAAKQTALLENDKPADVYPMTIDYRSVMQNFAEGVASSRDFEADKQTQQDGRSVGYQPMRNLHLIATAAGIADHNDASAIYHGAQGGDEADYPDCRPEFMTAAENAVNCSLADKEHIELRTPLIDMEKHEVIKRADELGVYLNHTYSCYEAIEDDDPEPCGECPACIERGEAFHLARVTDPFGTPDAVKNNSPEAWENILEEVSHR